MPRAHSFGLTAGVRAIELLSRLIGQNARSELAWQREHGDDVVRQAAADLVGAADAPPAHRVRIEVLGPAQVCTDDKVVASPASRRIRVRQLLSLLAIEPTVRRDRAMTLLWPDLDQTAASRNLRVTLTYLRQVLRGSANGERRLLARREIPHRRLVVDPPDRPSWPRRRPLAA